MADTSGRYRWYTVVLVLLLALQAGGGFFIPQLYRDNAWVQSAFRGMDIMTLAVIIPLLIILQILIQRGSLRARLAWAGTAFCIFYNNLYYLFAAFNRFFLVYVAITIVSLFALGEALAGIDRADIERRAAPGMPRGAISFIMMALAAVLVVMWVGQSVGFIVTGQVPQIIIDSGGPSHMVAALDLTVIAPVLVLGAVLLRRAQAWGYIISAAALVTCTLITASLTLAGPVQAAAGVTGAWTMVPLWVLMGIGFLTAAILLLRNIRTEEK